VLLRYAVAEAGEGGGGRRREREGREEAGMDLGFIAPKFSAGGASQHKQARGVASWHTRTVSSRATSISNGQ